MGYDNGIVDKDYKIDIEFCNIREALRAHFPKAKFVESEQGDSHEVLTSLLDQIEQEVGHFFVDNNMGFRSTLYLYEKRSIKCCGCGHTRCLRGDRILFLTFIYNERQKKDHKMSTLMKSTDISERVSNVEACEMCHEIHDIISSISVIGTPRFIFYYTKIIEYDHQRGKRKKKCLFKMLLQQQITVKDRHYNLRGIISHTGTNKHLKKKGEEEKDQQLVLFRQ